MDRIIIFFVGAVASQVSEIFWNGDSPLRVALWGGTGMLLLRRSALRFPFGDRTQLCLLGAFLLLVLRLVFLLFPALSFAAERGEDARLTLDLPSFSYGLYRFLLVAPAYAVIEYLEAHFG